MQSDPISVTPTGGSAQSMGRTQVSVGQVPSLYRTGDGLYLVSIYSVVTKNGRRRTGWKITQNKVVPDPLLPTTNLPRSLSFSVTYDVPDFGFSETEVTALAGGWSAWSTTGANANQLKLIRGET